MGRGGIVWLTTATVVAGLLLAPATAMGQVKTSPPAVDLLTDADVQIDGAVANDYSGSGVGGEVDFNDDGFLDLLVGATGADPSGRSGAGSSWIVYGSPAPLIDLATVGAGATRLDGAAAGDSSGISISRAGDVNCDSIGDVIVGAYNAGGTGRAYVVFGTRTPPASIDLNALGARGFRIDGAAANDSAGWPATEAGNVNGDECDDVLVGAKGHDSLGRQEAGAAFVVFGKSNTAAVDLGALGSGGYPIYGANSGDNAGYSVANAGDVSGDGVPDQLIGAPRYTKGTAGDAGAAYLVQGKANTTAIDLAALGTAGRRMEGADASDWAGNSVDNAGDVNLDGRPDHIIGAPNADSRGKAYVVHGSTSSSTVDLGALTTGYEIVGALGSSAGYAVAGLGRASGGLGGDQVVGAPSADNAGRSQSGSAFVVEGQSATTAVDLETYQTGFRLDAPGANLFMGEDVAATGNVGGSSAGDVMVSTIYGSANGRTYSGSTYVAYGENTVAIRPIIRNLSLSNLSFGLPGRKASTAASRGTVIRYRLTARATVRMRIRRVLRGRLVPGRSDRPVSVRDPLPRCVRGKPRRPRGQPSPERACVRLVRVGTLVKVHRRAGRARVRFLGRVRRRVLRPGRYSMEITARDQQGRVHGPVRVTFRVRRR